MNTKVLIVDDEPSACQMCVEILSGMGLKTETADSGTRALTLLATGRVDIVLTDVRMPGIDGIELLKILRQKYPQTDVVIMTGYGTIQASVEAIKLGAYDYLTKPIHVDDFTQVFRRLVEKQELEHENRALREQMKMRKEFAGLVGTSAAMQKIFRLIHMAASNRQPVLILGESGTGKELVARAIHAHGPRKDNPFVPVDCGALTPALVESELFGHVRGAFTGASQSRQGLLASAQGGTVFLDEIAELPVELQAKLLRALQENEVRAIGGNEWTHLDVRVIAATNQNLNAAIDRGTFRKDLYFRLNVLSIHVPPLRDRKSDIPELVRYLLARHVGDERPATVIARDAMVCLMRYNWPGNIRELENTIKRALVLWTGPTIRAQDLPAPLLDNPPEKAKSGEGFSLKEVESQAIMKALQAAGGNRPRAAKLLGIGKTTIYRKINEYGLDKQPKTHPRSGTKMPVRST
jgi:DNA-binding NtrC family response regulator